MLRISIPYPYPQKNGWWLMNWESLLYDGSLVFINKIYYYDYWLFSGGNPFELLLHRSTTAHFGIASQTTTSCWWQHPLTKHEAWTCPMNPFPNPFPHFQFQVSLRRPAAATNICCSPWVPPWRIWAGPPTATCCCLVAAQGWQRPALLWCRWVRQKVVDS